MAKLSKWLHWLDNNLLKILLIGSLFIVPLYPKIPLKMITYTYVAVRLEDIYIAILYAIFALYVLRRKVVLPRKFVVLFCLYWVAVFASFVYGVYIKQNLHYHQLAFLNAARRIEYMGIFFVAAAVVKKREDVLFYLKWIFFVFMIVGVYGIGQKFLGWPAVQTMNAEYAKGYILFLTPEARISSTFAGHYDLAAYLVFLIPLVIGFYFFQKRIKYILLFLISLFALVLTASRASYIAYIVSTASLLIWFRKFKYLLGVILVTAVFTLLSGNLTSRLQRTFQVKRIFVNETTGQVYIPQKISADKLPAGGAILDPALLGSLATKNISKTATNEALLRQELFDQVREKAAKEGKKLTVDEAEALVASIAGTLKPMTTVVSDISFSTRLQVEWPRALIAFVKNPLLGTGPSSITESTDNDYLRSLGEVGLLGSITFGLIFFFIIKTVFVGVKRFEEREKMVYFGFLFGLFGLLINATYIDVFEASKVAYTFWIISGLFVGSLLLKESNS